MLTPVSPNVVPTTQVAPAGASGRIRALDGLRGLAIFLVLVNHGPAQIHSGSPLVSRLLSVADLSFSGVDLFFVLSGFLIGGILLDARSSPRYFSAFYVRRAYRILPIYFLVLLIYSLGYLPFDFLHASATPTTIPFGAYASFTQNLWMAYLGSFGGVTLGVTWSLAVEEQFYLTAPLIVRQLTRAHLTYLMAAVVLLAPLLRIWLLFGVHAHHVAVYVLMPCRADALCLGVLCALLFRHPYSREILVRNRIPLTWITIALLVIVVGMAYQGWGPLSPPMATAGYTLLAFLYTGCLLIALLKIPVVERVLSTQWLMKLGGISYCVYLIHRPVIRAATQLLGGSLQRAGVHFHFEQSATITLGALIGIGLTIVIANLSWRFFEQPMIRRGHTYKF